MNNTTRRAYVLYAVLGAFFVGFIILIYTFIMNGSDWATKKANQHLYSQGSISAAGSIYDCNENPLAQTVNGKRRYHEYSNVRKATLHTVGDLNGFIATGVQYTYRHTLTGYDFVNGISSIVQYGKGNDVYLTIDKNLQVAIYNILEQRIAGIVVDKISNIYYYDPSTETSASRIKIPISDVFFSLFDNNIINMEHFTNENAYDTEK